VSVARIALVLCAALGGQAAAAQPSSAPSDVRYRVECGAEPPCRVDVATYVGYRVFAAQCASCHAADALGSSFAPDLTLRLRGRTARDFFVALDRGYLGPLSTMPPRGRDPNVAPYYDELWAFLSARRDGALPPGPPELLPEADAGR
jgi:hypothetical protein